MSTQGVLAYRLVKQKWVDSAFDGEGAKRYGGRFNSRGLRCVYLASSEALAILEVMVHLEDYRLLEHYALFRLTLPPDLIMQLDLTALPPNWREDPAPNDTALIGDEWLRADQGLALAVPSTIAVRETNYLLNPQHPRYNELVSHAEHLPFSVDLRLRR